MGVVGIVLLIAISNVAGLLLARNSARAHELRIRSALGAERARIIRQLLTESLLLSCVGGLFGISLAHALVRLLIRLNPGGIPRFDSASIDLRVLLVAIAVSLATGITVGLFPALSASRPSVSDRLKKGGARVTIGTHRGRFALVVLEVSLSVVLLSAAGLLIRSYLEVQRVDRGFLGTTLTLKVDLDEKYSSHDSQVAFYQALLRKLETLPGFRYVAASTSLPLNNEDSLTTAEIKGFGHPKEMVENRSVTVNYRKALGTPLLRGRDFTAQDITHPLVAMINAKFAQTYFPGRDPIGGQIRIGLGDLSQNPWMTVVGVVADIRHMALDRDIEPQLFQPSDAGENNTDNFAIRADLPVREAADEARAALRSLDPALAPDIKTMNDRVTTSNARRTFQTSLLTGFATVAVTLALVGLYGLMLYTVKQRSAEIGIRLAIGSPRSGVLSLIVCQGMRPTVCGLLLGLGASFAVTRLLSSWLFGVQAIDPLTFVLVPILVLVASCCACLIPAWSAIRIDPIQTLRQE